MGYTSSDGNYRTEDLGTSPSSYTIYRSFPRTRGDVPSFNSSSISGAAFPPHTRGCTGFSFFAEAAATVSPAHAGMYRRRLRRASRHYSFPRTRGDVPCIRLSNTWEGSFPPHTRGCTVAVFKNRLFFLVSPAHAGMYRQLST